MLDRTDFASWKQQIRFYCRGKETGVNNLKSIDQGPYQMGTVREPLAEGTEGAPHLGLERPRVYSDLSPKEKDRGQGMNPQGGGVARYGGVQNRVGNVNPSQARLVKCYNYNGAWLKRTDELWTQRSYCFLQADDYDAFDSDVDKALTAQTMFMANLSSADPVTDEAGPLYDSDILSEDLEESIIMRNKELNTIFKKESDEFINSSVEDLVPIPSESEDTSGSESVCILPSRDDFSPIDVPEEKAVTFSNPLFNSNDYFISSDDGSLSDEDVQEDNVKIYSNPLFEFDDEYIYSDVNPLFDKVLEDTECKDSYDPNLDELTFLVTPLFDSNEDEYFTPGDDVELLLHHDSSIPKMNVASILEGFIDEPPLEENDDLFYLDSKNDEWKKILRLAPTPSPSPLTSLSPPSAGERLARCTAPAALPSPLLLPSLYPPPPVDRSRYEIGESSMRGQDIDYGFADTVEAETRHRGIREVGYGIRDTWIDPVEAVPKMETMTLEKVNTRVTELAELHEHNTQDLYALLEDAQDGRTRISQRVAMDSQRVDLLIGDRMTLQETVWIVEEEAYAAREAWAHLVGLSQTVHHELQTLREQISSVSVSIPAYQCSIGLTLSLGNNVFICYCLGKDNRVNILKSIDKDPFKMGKFRETLAEGAEGVLHLGTERDRVFADLIAKEKERFKPDIRAMNIVFQADMSSASSAVTYTSVYIDSEPRRVFLGADEELSDRKDEHILSAEEHPLPPIVSPNAESPGYVAESDPEEDPEEYEEDETEDGPVDYPMDGGDNGDDDDGDSSGYDADDEDEDEEEEEEEHLAPADSVVVIPIDELASPHKGTEPIIPPPSTDTATTRARITIQP
nr:integrase, catalytic region, zinc finger, CCHC-type, peptidase aspartic, catalytic [Tanacetum cinerariifolium]